ncbi:urease accessory protein UreE [Carnimonas bestiolae]|uniref:urease accessory protein UreE n=1 Tax=Carnimonas bestiolae TaxID=3402172 RepID=UPI003EDC423E
MLLLTQRAADTGDHDTATAVLDFHTRLKSRARIVLDDGREAGLTLERGKLLRGGEVLTDAQGVERVRIVAANESVSQVTSNDPLLFATACYHLGNRHVPLQIEAGHLAYQHDHVLDDMVRGLGLEVITTQAPFEPVSGAYEGGGHSHAHGHDHAHGHHHDHHGHH